MQNRKGPARDRQCQTEYEQTPSWWRPEFVAARNPKRQSAIRPSVEDRGEKSAKKFVSELTTARKRGRARGTQALAAPINPDHDLTCEPDGHPRRLRPEPTGSSCANVGEREATPDECRSKSRNSSRLPPLWRDIHQGVWIIDQSTGTSWINPARWRVRATRCRRTSPCPPPTAALRRRIRADRLESTLRV